jgi:predicted dehydrogenase
VATHRLGIIMHGITGRMGLNQHLVRSIVAIRREGGVALPNGDRVMPDPILVGRNPERVAAIARQYGIERSTGDLDAALNNPADTVFFDAATTQMRADLITRAIEAGKHIYCEKPISDSLAKAVTAAKLARSRGIKHGVVQDKLFLPGLRKMRMLRDAGFFGRLFAVRGEFGYWVFEGGGIILDMLCHWRYVLDHVFAPVKAVSCMAATHIPSRVDEQGRTYTADVDDAAYATFELEGGAIAHINCSWCVRVRRDDLVTFQADGTHGSAVAGLTRCWTQHRVNTPRPVWNPDVPQTMNFVDQWEEVPENITYDNGFKIQWEDFIRHVVAGTPWKHDLVEGAKGVQLAELGLKSWAERRWLDVPKLAI